MDHSATDEALLREAIEIARERMLAGAGGPFGAIVARDGWPIAKGWNAVTTLLDPTAHAEVVAIRRACNLLGTFRLDGCTLYASCEPCPMCLASAYWARIPRIVFGAGRADAAAVGFDDAFIYDEMGLAHEERSVEMTQMLRGEAAAALGEWLHKDDRVPY
jgi:guanine deaminase